MKKLFSLIVILFTLSLLGTAFAQNDVSTLQGYEVGHGALEVFNSEAMAHTPKWVQYWIMFMAASFAAGLFFVRRHPIARWVVGGFVVGILVSSILTRGFGLLPLSGLIALIHLIFWSPALYQLLTKRPFLADKGAFSVWSAVITFVIIFSFVFDVRDAAIYLNHLF